IGLDRADQQGQDLPVDEGRDQGDIKYCYRIPRMHRIHPGIGDRLASL
ncbi:MAG: hypothetical protein HW386_2030, partial [Gammaproteobacteria bacterium]|nr:hypothetical protein [Gammaproteobacteria bacterium]